MKDQHTALPFSPETPLPAWFPEARQLASACHGLATGVEDLTSGQVAADKALQKTGRLLHVIGDQLEHATLDTGEGKIPVDPAALSLSLLQHARVLPQASTLLWNADANRTISDFGRMLPDVSMALMTLSRHVTESLPGRDAVVRCKS